MSPAPVLDSDDLSIDGEAFDASDEAPEIVGPQTIGEESLLRALYKDLARGEQAKAVLAETQMRQVIQLNQQLEHRPIDGLGVLAARIPLEVFLAWTAREGPDFWHEASNLDYFEKRANGVGNPGFRIKTKMKPTIVVDHQFDAVKTSGPLPFGPGSGVNSAGVAPSAAPVTASAAKVKSGRRGRWAA